MARICPKCGEALGEIAGQPASQPRFCAKCGAVVEDTSMKTLMQYAAPVIPHAASPTPAPSTAPAAPQATFGDTLQVPSRADAYPLAGDAPPRAVAGIEPPPTVPRPSADAAPPPSPGASAGKLKATMVQFAAVQPPAAGAPAEAPAPPPAAPAPHAAAKTMLGVAFHLPGAMPGAPPAAAPPPEAPPPAAPQAAAHVPSRTILGVAIPGVAPTAPGQPSAGPSGPRGSGTILGVAMPGIAPIRAGDEKKGGTMLLQAPPHAAFPAAPLEPIVPRPAPLEDEPLPDAPARAEKRGLPLAAVAGVLAALVLVVGVVVAVFWKGTPPIVARPALDASGREALHVACDGCADGTIVELGGNKAELKGHEATVLLAEPLRIGENPLSLAVTRPESRQETVNVVVPVAFRIRADMSTVSARPPVITVRVEAAPGSQVTVDGKPVSLDADGRGAYPIDISADTEGPSVEVKRIEKKIPYAVTRAGSAPAAGTLPAAIAVVPLQLDSPGLHAETDQKTFVVAGQTTPGATLTVNNEPVPLDAQGKFAKSFDAPMPGEIPVSVVSQAAQLAPRAAHFAVKRVDSLEAEAKATEAAGGLLSYDAARDIAAHVGERILVEGEIIETRLVGHQTILVMTDKRGCAAKADPNQCLARVLVGGADTRKKGDSVRVFGRITRPVMAQNGRAVPEIEADFLAKPRGR